MIKRLKFSRARAFTMVELLVVIAIIGILAVTIIVSITGAQAKARDAKRKTYARNIASALSQYHQDNALVYPIQNTSGGIDITTAGFENALSPTYIAQTNVFTHDKRAQYISTYSGSNYAQAWELENTQEATVTSANGVYLSKSGGAEGAVTVEHTASSALSFTANGVVAISNVAGYNTNAFSVSIWFNPSDLLVQRTIAEKYAGANGWQLQLNTNGTVTATLRVAAASVGTVTSTIAAGATVTAGTYSHVVLTYDGTAGINGIKLYIANSSSAITSTPNVQGTASSTAANTTAVALNISSTTTGFRGSIGDVRLYNAAIPGTQVVALHDDTGSFTGQYANNGEANLVGAWRMDDGRSSNATCPNTVTTAILCDVKGEAAPQAAATPNVVPLASFTNAPVWTTGIVPLGLTWNSPVTGGHAFVTYGPQ